MREGGLDLLRDRVLKGLNSSADFHTLKYAGWWKHSLALLCCYTLVSLPQYMPGSPLLVAAGENKVGQQPLSLRSSIHDRETRQI